MTEPTAQIFPAESNEPPATPAICRLMVVDDHPLVCSALSSLLSTQPDMVVCAQANSAASAMGLLERAKPDLIITDLTMPGRDGIDFIKDLRAFAPNIRVLVLTMHDEAQYAERALHAGANGFIMKAAGSGAILEAIRKVMSGSIAISPAASAQIVGRVTGASKASDSPVAGLSDREFGIFLLIGQGCDIVGIAEKLGLSRKTVDVHRANIKRKLKLPNSTALVRAAVQWVESQHPHSSGRIDEGLP